MDVRDSVVIDRPVADAWAFFQEPKNNFAWQADLLGQTMLCMGPDLVGRVGREHRTGIGESEWEATDCEPRGTIAFKSLSGPNPCTGAYRFEQVREGTRYSHDLHLDLPVAWRLISAVVKTVGVRRLQTNLARPKAMLEM